MAPPNTAKSTSVLSPRYIAYVYLPSAVLITAGYMINSKILAITLSLSLILAAWQFGQDVARMTFPPPSNQASQTNTYAPAGGNKKVLIPDTLQDFPISQITRISHNTAIYRFKLPDEKSILGLPIGQHISLAATLDVTDPKTGSTERKEVVRSYTPISSDVNPGYFDLLIKSYPTGNISRHLGTLKVGDTMKVKGPKGAMVYTPNMVRRFGMIAGGTGITPMLQVINAIRRGRAVGDRTIVDLIFANVNPEDILMKEELDSLAKADDKINVYYVLNNPPEGWTGGVGFVTADMIKVCFQRLQTCFMQ